MKKLRRITTLVAGIAVILMSRHSAEAADVHESAYRNTEAGRSTASEIRTAGLFSNSLRLPVPQQWQQRSAGAGPIYGVAPSQRSNQWTQYDVSRGYSPDHSRMNRPDGICPDGQCRDRQYRDGQYQVGTCANGQCGAGGCPNGVCPNGQYGTNRQYDANARYGVNSPYSRSDQNRLPARPLQHSQPAPWNAAPTRYNAGPAFF